MSSIMRCRSGLMALSVMRDAPVLMEVAKPLISRQDALTRYPIGRIVRCCAYRASGLDRMSLSM
jgi:hypothetical protein